MRETRQLKKRVDGKVLHWGAEESRWMVNSYPFAAKSREIRGVKSVKNLLNLEERT
jgi:hypothetical protein